MGRAQLEVTPPESPKRVICLVKSMVSSLKPYWTQAQKQQTIRLICVSKLEPTQKPVLGANNMPLNVVRQTGVTIQLGGIRDRHKVLVCRGLPQQVLIGINFLTAYKCNGLTLTLTRQQ